jgi:maleate isomerase
MAYTSWRGVVGCIKPTMRPGGIEELIRILPDGVCLLPLFLDIRKGTVDEFKRAVEPYEPMLARLAEAKVDIIHPEGAPPFMLLGFNGEANVIKRWEDKYGIPIFTSGSNHVREVFRRGGVRRARHGGARRAVSGRGATVAL